MREELLGDELMSPVEAEAEIIDEPGLRPRTLSEFVGQAELKGHLGVMLGAAAKRRDPADHLLFAGPPGLGKTTLANIIAAEMGTHLQVTSGPALERAGDLASILSKLEEGDVLFIDEIHRLGKIVEEILYPAMEDFSLSWVMGKGLSAQSINLKIEPFTLVGATTRFAMLSAPLRDRFGATYRLDFYDIPAMEHIVARSAEILNVKIVPEGVSEVARRARGTPRVANRLLRRVRDYAQVRANGVVTADVAAQGLALLEVDSLGLDDIDRRVLHAIAVTFEGGPVGLETIAASIGEESDTIMDVYEPYLMQLGFLSRTPRGRIATKGAYAHLGLPYPAKLEQRQATFWNGQSQ